MRLTTEDASSVRPARAGIQRMQAELSRRLVPGVVDELLRLLRKLNDLFEGDLGTRPV